MPFHNDLMSEKNQKKRPYESVDLILVAVTLYVAIRTPWNNMTGFHLIMLCLVLVCIVMRITNKQLPARKAAYAKKMREKEEAKKAKALAALAPPEEDATVEGTQAEEADEVPVHTMTIDIQDVQDVQDAQSPSAEIEAPQTEGTDTPEEVIAPAQAEAPPVAEPTDNAPATEPEPTEPDLK